MLIQITLTCTVCGKSYTAAKTLVKTDIEHIEPRDTLSFDDWEVYLGFHRLPRGWSGVYIKDSSEVNLACSDACRARHELDQINAEIAALKDRQRALQAGVSGDA